MKTTTPQMDNYLIEAVICQEGRGYFYHEGGIVEIQQHVAQGEGDKWYYDVTFRNSTVLRLFDVRSVSFVKKESANGNETDV